MSFSIDMPELPALVNALERYPAVAEPIIRDATGDALLLLVPDLSDYPAELPHQRYVRTFKLRDGWTDAVPEWTPISSGFEAKLTNPTAYTDEVQGWKDQARVHKGRWKTDQQIVDAREADIKARFDTALQDIADAVGGVP